MYGLFFIIVLSEIENYKLMKKQKQNRLFQLYQSPYRCFFVLYLKEYFDVHVYCTRREYSGFFYLY